MSRLQRHEEKTFKRTVILYGILFVLFMIFVFTYGIKLLFGTALFVANFDTKKTPSQPLTKAENSINNIEVSDIPDATNSAQFVVNGTILNFDTLIFYINGEKVKETTVPYSDSFSVEIGDLKKGTNEVYITAKSTKDKTSKNSQKYTVTYLNDKPKLDIQQPGDNSKTNNQDQKVEGKTDKEVFIKVNDLPVVVDANGSFSTSVKLHDGDNKITITAQDVAGNIETKTLTVTYKKDD